MAADILVITQDGDMHVPFVQRHLDTKLIVIDPAQCVQGRELSYEYVGNRLRTIYDGHELKDIKSVWYRKPKPIWGGRLPVKREHQEYVETALISHTRELYVQFADALWISDYYAIRRADHKGLQQSVAGSLGFAVPDTLATSDKAAALRFIESKGEVIVKSLASAFPNTADGQPTMFYSRKIKPSDASKLAGLNLAPAIFQKVIDHDIEIRVTVVGTKVFAARVQVTEVDSESSLRDWRVGHLTDSVQFEEYTLPKDVAERCVVLVRKLGLQYGAIDLIQDKQGTLWFLENNPNGQWAFIEEATGQQIGKAIAEMLAKGKK